MTNWSHGGFVSIVHTEQIKAVLIHADTFCFCVIGQTLMQALGDAKFELARVFLDTFRGYIDSSSCQTLLCKVMIPAQCLGLLMSKT